MIASMARGQLAWLACASLTSAQYVMNDLSFGHHGIISHDGGHGIPNWGMSSENHKIQILSDRVILTPPVPGNARSAAWADKSVHTNEWTAEMHFRASGPEDYSASTGNLNLWYVKDKSQVGLNSVYTVEKFEGLVIVIDQYGHTGGKVRGFLNDGTANYRAHLHPESLAFGHCDYHYRNLGYWSQLTIHNQDKFSVLLDGFECFSTDKIQLPEDYYFGLTAATADNPDSFEIDEFVVISEPPSHPAPPAAQQSSASGSQGGDQAPPLQKLDRFPGSPEALPDKNPDEIKGTDAQFEDLHNRLQGMTHQTANLFQEFDIQRKTLDHMLQTIMAALPPNHENHIVSINKRLDHLEQMVHKMSRDLETRDYKEHITDLQSAVESIRGGLREHLPDTMKTSKLLSPLDYICSFAN
jgi:lectin, mannose-binding 1